MEITEAMIASFDIGEHAPHLLNRATIAISRLWEAKMEQHGLSLGAWRILAVLHRGGPMRVRELLHATGIEPPTLSRLLATLQTADLLSRTPSDDDARGVMVHPTAAGMALTELLIPQSLGLQERLLDGFTDDERDFLVRLLKRARDNALSPEVAASFQRVREAA
jgi:DNA-binding MarR family transcriptional regulator